MSKKSKKKNSNSKRSTNRSEMDLKKYEIASELGINSESCNKKCDKCNSNSKRSCR